MADYIIPTASGTIVVPHGNRVSYKGMTLVGRDEENWNEPLQRNFVALRDILETKMDSSFDQDLIAKTHGDKDIGTLTKAFRNLFLTGSVYLNGIKAITATTDIVTYSGKDGQTVKVHSKGAANLELGSTGNGKVILISDLYLSPLRKLRTLDGSPLVIGDPLKVEGPVVATTYNGIDLATLATKAEVPDISAKAEKSELPTKLSQLANDPGYLTTHQSLAAYATSVSVNTQITGLATSIRGGVTATHDTLAKMKSGYESAVSALAVVVATNKSDGEAVHATTLNQITIEKNRAIGAEGALDDSLAVEITRAKNAESTIASNLNAEVTRASDVETQLQTDLNAEVSRASNKEAQNAAALVTEKDRAEAAEGILTTAVNTEAAQRAAGDQASLDAVADEQTRAEGAEATVTGLVSNETTRAMAAESTLDGKISTENARAVAEENTVKASVLTEKSRAQSAESVLEDDIAAINTLLASDTIALNTVQELVTAIKANQADLALIDLSVKVSRNTRVACKIGGNGIVIS